MTESSLPIPDWHTVKKSAYNQPTFSVISTALKIRNFLKNTEKKVSLFVNSQQEKIIQTPILQ